MEQKLGKIAYREVYEVLASSFPFHYPIDDSINVYAVNAADAVIKLLVSKGIKVEGTRECLTPKRPNFRR